MTRPLQVDEENALLMRETMTSALRLGSIPVVDPSQVCWLVRELGFGFSVTQYAAPGLHPCGRPISGVLAGADLHLISVRLLGLSQALRLKMYRPMRRSNTPLAAPTPLLFQPTTPSPLRLPPTFTDQGRHPPRAAAPRL